MANKKNNAKDFFSSMPFWGWADDNGKDQWEEFKSGMEKLWKQQQEMQKAAEKAWKEQWDTFFSKLMDMEQTVADALPDEKPAAPGMPAAPVSPKELVEKAKEFQVKANAHVVEQAENMRKIRTKRRQQVKEIVTDAVNNVKANIEAVQPVPVKEEKAEEKPEVKTEENLTGMQEK